MLNLIKKDLFLIFSSKVNLLVIILYIPLMNIILYSSHPERMIAITIISLGYILASISFSYEIATKSYFLIQSLPIKKRDVVISKYISIFINYMFGVIFTGGYLWIISLFGSRAVDSFNFSLIKDILPILVLGLSISLPVNFRLSPKVANFTNIFILVTIMNAVVMTSDGIDTDFNTMSIANLGKLGLPIAVAAIYLISMVISIWLYEERDLI